MVARRTNKLEGGNLYVEGAEVNSGNPVPVTGTVTSTPSGTQDVNIVGDTVGLATEATLSDVEADTSSIDSKITACDTDDVTITSSVLPTGAATAANQSTIIGHVDGLEALLSTIDADTSTIAGDTTSIDSKITACDTGNVTVTASALPSGAATAANQSTIIGHVDGIEALLTTIDADTSTIAGDTTSIDSKITACNTGNVTIGSALPTGSNTIGAVNQGNHKTSGQGWRVTQYGTAGLPTAYFNIAGVFEIPTVVVGDPFTGTPWAFEFGTNGGRIAGTLNDDVADSGSPVKIGGRATDMKPDSAGTQGPTAVADGDRKNLVTDLQGRIGVYPNAEYRALTTLNDTYDNTTTTNTSTAYDCWLYRKATLFFTLAKANTPTLFIVEIETSGDGTNYAKVMNGPLAAWIYDDVEVGSGISRALTFPLVGQKVRVKVTATGTTASNTFTMSNAVLYMES